VERAGSYRRSALLLARHIREEHAQQVTGDVVGTVTDNTGGVIPGASVTIKNQGTGEARTANSSEQGEFSFPLLQPGTYNG